MNVLEKGQKKELKDFFSCFSKKNTEFFFITDLEILKHKKGTELLKNLKKSKILKDPER